MIANRYKRLQSHTCRLFSSQKATVFEPKEGEKNFAPSKLKQHNQVKAYKHDPKVNLIIKPSLHMTKNAEKKA